MTTAYQLDYVLQLAKHNPPCDCGHVLLKHDMDDVKGPCTVCECAAYQARPCLQLDPSHLPCSKPVGHDGPHYMLH